MKDGLKSLNEEWGEHLHRTVRPVDAWLVGQPSESQNSLDRIWVNLNSLSEVKKVKTLFWGSSMLVSRGRISKVCQEKGDHQTLISGDITKIFLFHWHERSRNKHQAEKVSDPPQVSWRSCSVIRGLRPHFSRESNLWPSHDSDWGYWVGTLRRITITGPQPAFKSYIPSAEVRLRTLPPFYTCCCFIQQF